MNPSSKPHETSEQRALPSIRRDVIMNLEPFLQQEELLVSKPSNGKKVLAALSSKASQSLRQQRLEYENLRPGSNANDDDTSMAATMPVGGKKNGYDGGSSRTQRPLISQSDRNSIKTYHFRIAEQLRLCDRVVKAENKTLEYVCGFECIHCMGKLFRKFPETHQEVANEIVNFRTHLNYCTKVPHDLRSYLLWMESWRSSSRLHSSSRMDSLTKLISHRLNVEEAKGNAALTKARERAVLRKRKLSHSVLENVELLDSTNSMLR